MLSSVKRVRSEGSITYLAPLGLGQYAAIIDANGGESHADIAFLSSEELQEEFDMKRLHALKLKRWLEKCGDAVALPPPIPFGGGAAIATRAGSAAETQDATGALTTLQRGARDVAEEEIRWDEGAERRAGAW